MTDTAIEVIKPVEDAIITKLRDWKADDEAFAYAQTVEMGRVCQKNRDKSCWVIGDLACFVETEYGENRLAQFADDINVAFDRVSEYRTMARFWTFPARAEYSELEQVTYSHMRVAKSLKNLDVAKDFLKECVLNAWTVRDARLEANRLLGKEPEPKESKAASTPKPTPILDTEAYITSIKGSVMTLSATNLSGLVRGKRYRFEVFECEDYEDGEDSDD